jgi:heavy metal sensor kinase
MFSSIRVRLTLWYLLVFGGILIAFSAYIYSSISRDMRKRFDASLLRTAQAMASYFTEFAERKNVIRGAEETIRELKEGREIAAIFREGQLLASNGEEIIAALASTNMAARSVGSGREPAFATEPRLNKRLVVAPFHVDGVNYTVAVLEPLDKLEGQIGQMRNIIFFALSSALALAAVGGFLMACKSLGPVVTISEQAEHISAKNLSERLKVTNTDDELGHLAGVFNALLSRLDASFQVMREFMADASHELRTPLAIINGEAQVSLAQDRTPDEYRQALGVVRDQAKRMARIVSDMLALARADAGQQRLRMQELYLNDLVEECYRAAQALAAPKGVQLTYEAGEDISFLGDEELLKRMVINLLDNAIRYTPGGGAVSVKLTCEPMNQSGSSCARLIISDSGMGIPPECLGRVFDRFYRVDDSRARANGGSGLGLSIVKLAAESHRGSVGLVSEPNHGSTFTVSLPL